MDSFILIDGIILWAIYFLIVLLIIGAIYIFIKLVKKNNELQKKLVISRQKNAILERDKYIMQFNNNLKDLENKK